MPLALSPKGFSRRLRATPSSWCHTACTPELAPAIIRGKGSGVGGWPTAPNRQVVPISRVCIPISGGFLPINRLALAQALVRINGQTGSNPVVPVKSPFDQVHWVSEFGGLNLSQNPVLRALQTTITSGLPTNRTQPRDPLLRP